MDSIEDEIDSLFGDQYPELEKVKENIKFDKAIKNVPIKKDEAVIKVFGYHKFDLADILKLNPWDRSIYTTDHLCRLYVKANFEQMKKYLAKKRQIPTNLVFIILIAVGVTVAVLALIFVLGLI